jgi:hypothetical protein
MVPAVSCSKCGADLREGLQICPDCGEPISPPENKTAVESEGSAPAVASPSAESDSREARLPRRRGLGLWILLGILLLGMLWAATSGNPLAQGIQAMAGSKQDQTVISTPFTVSAHSFRYYKLPATQANHVELAGTFAVSSATPSEGQTSSDDGIEVYVMTDSAFTTWLNGYAANYAYESGRVTRGNVDAELPDEGGVYYLVFSNKFSTKSAKRVNADIALRYKSWMPQSLRRAGVRFWNWFGL